MVPVTETPIPGGATAGGFPPAAVVQAQAGGAIAGGIGPTQIVWPAALLPLLTEALQRLDQVTAFHAHPPADHHDDVAKYTDATVALMAFVIAVWMVLRRVL